MKALTRLFLSLKTTFAIFLAFIVLAVIGSLSLVNNLAFFSGVDDTPLFRWLLTADDLRKTWWMYALIIALAFLAVNTIFCTVESVLKKIGGRNLMLKLAPQVMHVGVLFIMLGHLMTASLGFKADVSVGKGVVTDLFEGGAIFLEDIRVETDTNGYITNWEALVRWHEGGSRSERRSLRPAQPLYFGKVGLYARSVANEPEPSALIRVSRDPGAPWALLGGFLLALGGVIFSAWRRTG